MGTIGLEVQDYYMLSDVRHKINQSRSKVMLDVATLKRSIQFEWKGIDSKKPWHDGLLDNLLLLFSKQIFGWILVSVRLCNRWEPFLKSMLIINDCCTLI